MKVNWGKVVAYTLIGVLITGFVLFVLGRVIVPLAASAGATVFASVTVADLVFYALAAMTLVGAAGVALSRNILYSAIGLLLGLLGAGSLYVYLAADFVAVTQLLVYIGGVLVLVLFAVMLTSHIRDINVSNTSVGVPAGAVLFLATAAVVVYIAVQTPWAVQAAPVAASTVAPLGNAFLTRWLLPFEVASLVLLATLVGAIVIARKELKAD